MRDSADMGTLSYYLPKWKGSDMAGPRVKRLFFNPAGTSSEVWSAAQCSAAVPGIFTPRAEGE